MDEFVSAVVNTMRFTVVMDWSVYPLGYFFIPSWRCGYNVLNLTYNLANMLNNILFVTAIWWRRSR